MKAIQPNQLLILGIALASSSMAAEVDLGFRYNQKDNICVNDRGQVGHNPDFMGECGMLSGKDLTWAIRTFPWDAMPGAILDDSILYGADFTNLNLMGASLRNADLRLISLDGANLSFANLTGSRFGNSFLSRANLTGANLSNLDLSDANVRMANFSKADLTAASFRANQNVHQAKFDEARLSTANLQGAYLYGASFRKANLAGADLSHSQLLGADLSDSNVEGARFSEASFSADTRLPFSKEAALSRGMRFIEEAESEGKIVEIAGNSDGTCAPAQIHLMKGEKVTFSLKGDPSMMFLLTIPDFGIELMTMGSEPVRKNYVPNQGGTFNFTCGPHGAPSERQTHGTVMVM